MNSTQKSNLHAVTRWKLLFMLICNTPLLLLESRNSWLSAWE